MTSEMWDQVDRPRRRGRRVDRDEVALPDGRLLRLNDTAMAIWEAADGATTLAELADAIAALTGMTPTQATAAVTEAVRELQGSGLLEDEPTADGS